jgi:hypothetical protein
MKSCFFVPQQAMNSIFAANYYRAFKGINPTVPVLHLSGGFPNTAMETLA